MHQSWVFHYRLVALVQLMVHCREQSHPEAPLMANKDKWASGIYLFQVQLTFDTGIEKQVLKSAIQHE